jgi:hypothetical protein
VLIDDDVEHNMAMMMMVPRSSDDNHDNHLRMHRTTCVHPRWTSCACFNDFELVSASLQTNMIWIWDFFHCHADILNLRSMCSLPVLVDALQLRDGSAPDGSTVSEEQSAGRLLATLHVIVLDVLLRDYVPKYLFPSTTTTASSTTAASPLHGPHDKVRDYLLTRPLNLWTWPEVARQMCMIALEVRPHLGILDIARDG